MVTIRVNCSATGSPLPKIRWYKNNVSLPVFNNVTTDEVTSELVIGQFKPSDQATYTCVARNMYNDEVRTDAEIGKRSQYIMHLILLVLVIILKSDVYYDNKKKLIEITFCSHKNPYKFYMKLMNY